MNCSPECITHTQWNWSLTSRCRPDRRPLQAPPSWCSGSGPWCRTSCSGRSSGRLSAISSHPPYPGGRTRKHLRGGCGEGTHDCFCKKNKTKQTPWHSRFNYLFDGVFIAFFLGICPLKTNLKKNKQHCGTLLNSATVRSLSSARVKWERKQKCCLYIFVQCIVEDNGNPVGLSERKIKNFTLSRRPLFPRSEMSSWLILHGAAGPVAPSVSH